MAKVISEHVKKVLKAMDIKVTKYGSFQKLVDGEKVEDSIRFILALPEAKAYRLLENLSDSKSQLRQDLFVLSELDFKKDGYFVEFGATNGVDLSNTHILEKKFNWNGILSEPAKCWHKDLVKNRECHIEKDCIWSSSGKVLKFNEVEFNELSTLTEFNSSDSFSKIRERGKRYDVSTISLMDLLQKYNAPSKISYLSIDTEGSEYEILKDFDFNKYSFDVITCEHNYTDARGKILDLLVNNGYVRKYQNLSKFDDWFVKV